MSIGVYSTVNIYRKFRSVEFDESSFPEPLIENIDTFNPELFLLPPKDFESWSFRDLDLFEKCQSKLLKVFTPEELRVVEFVYEGKSDDPLMFQSILFFLGEASRKASPSGASFFMPNRVASDGTSFYSLMHLGKNKIILHTLQ